MTDSTGGIEAQSACGADTGAVVNVSDMSTIASILSGNPQYSGAATVLSGALGVYLNAGLIRSAIPL